MIINMDYDDVFDRSEARILIDDLINGNTNITLEQIREKIIDLEKEISLNHYIITEYKISNSKLQVLVKCSMITCDECGNDIYI